MENTTNEWLRNRALDIIRRAKAEGYTQIKLAGYHLQKLPDELFELEQLENLDISYNYLSEIPPAIARLSNLQFLDLSGNRLQKLPTEIGKLSKLQYLYISANPLQHLPEPILKLDKLKHLKANLCKITSLPEAIDSLTNLETLYLVENHLNDLPESFRNLHKIRLCFLEENPFKADVADKKPRSRYLALFRYDKPTVGLPPSIHEEAPQSGIVGEKPQPRPVENIQNNILNEARVIVLGLPGAGKTTLCRKIIDANAPFEHPGSTEGIDIYRWQFETTPDQVPLIANLWDFGGQEKYEAYHPFFMTDAYTVYVVVANGVEENKENLYKWLQIVKNRAENSPIIVVISKADERRWEHLDEAHLRETFPQLGATAILRVSSKTGENIEKLRKNIKEAIKNLPGFAQESQLVAGWQKIRTQIDKLSQPDASGRTLTHINVSDFEDICKQEGITDLEYIKALGSYLHNIGAALYYPDNMRLNHLMVLDMKWAVNGIYKILDSPIIAQNKGRFNQRNAVDVWKASDKNEVFPISTHGYLIELLKDFEFCYEWQQGDFIVPDKLPISRPATLPELHGDLLQARLKYEDDEGSAVKFPKGLLTRLMIKYGMNVDWENSWQSGITLHYGDARAIVEQTKENIIQIKIGGTAAYTGRDRFSLFQMLKSELNLLCAERKLPSEYLTWEIPCQCSHVEMNKRCYFSEQQLFELNKTDRQVTCMKSKPVSSYSITNILCAVYNQFEDGWEQTAKKLKEDRAESLFNQLKAKDPTYDVDKHLKEFNLFTLKKDTGEAGRIRQRMITVCIGANSNDLLRNIARDLSMDMEIFIRKRWNINERVTLGGLIGSNSDFRKTYPEFEKDIEEALAYRNEEVHTNQLQKYGSEKLAQVINIYFRVYLLAFLFDPKTIPVAPKPPATEPKPKKMAETKYQGKIIGLAPGAVIISCDELGKQKVAWEGGKGKKEEKVSFTLKTNDDGTPMKKPFTLPNGCVVHNYVADKVTILPIDKA